MRGGRTFVRRLIDLSVKLKLGHHRTWLTRDARADLIWWAEGLNVYHGHTPFIQDMKPPHTLFVTDSCRIGGGGIFNTDWFYVNFAADYPEFANAHINDLELLTVLEAAKRWSHLWRGMHIRVLCDNTATVQSIDKGTSKSPSFMTCLRHLFWLSVKYDFRLTACHIPGSHNVAADLISRLHVPDMARKFLKFMSPSRNFVNCFNHMSLRTFLKLQATLSSIGS